MADIEDDDDDRRAAPLGEQKRKLEFCLESNLDSEPLLSTICCSYFI